KGKHAGEWRDQAEERKVRQYVLKHMGNFDITKRGHTEQEKRQMVEFLNATRYDFAIAVVVRILLESRGAYEKIEQKRHVDNLVLKLRGWQKLDSADPINGLKKKPRDMSKLRKINPDLVREAILAIGSSAPRKGYKAYYDYYMELEREKRPDFQHSFNNFMLWCDKLIKKDRQLQ
ncbi:hypothetical protein, partial [Helicobacter suis]|uniref:hypothetical protein n=1 Tax=Helicobacter suis TaxID=104628 RepID=UPI0013D04AC3